MTTLTGNDIALAQQAVQLAIAWHTARPTSGFGSKQIENLKALLPRLSLS